MEASKTICIRAVSLSSLITGWWGDSEFLKQQLVHSDQHLPKFPYLSDPSLFHHILSEVQAVFSTDLTYHSDVSHLIENYLVTEVLTNGMVISQHTFDHQTLYCQESGHKQTFRLV